MQLLECAIYSIRCGYLQVYNLLACRAAPHDALNDRDDAELSVQRAEEATDNPPAQLDLKTIVPALVPGHSRLRL